MTVLPHSLTASTMRVPWKADSVAEVASQMTVMPHSLAASTTRVPWEAVSVTEAATGSGQGTAADERTSLDVLRVRSGKGM